MAQQLYDKAGNNVFPKVQCVNNLTSASTTEPLSAAQGKALKDLIDSKTHIQFKIVAALNTTGESNVIYLVPKTEANGTNDAYDEYVWINGKYEYLGTMTTPAVVTEDNVVILTGIDPLNNNNITTEKIDNIQDAINHDKILLLKYDEYIINLSYVKSNDTTIIFNYIIDNSIFNMTINTDYDDTDNYGNYKVTQISKEFTETDIFINISDYQLNAEQINILTNAINNKKTIKFYIPDAFYGIVLNGQVYPNQINVYVMTDTDAIYRYTIPTVPSEFNYGLLEATMFRLNKPINHNYGMIKTAYIQQDDKYPLNTDDDGNGYIQVDNVITVELNLHQCTITKYEYDKYTAAIDGGKFIRIFDTDGEIYYNINVDTYNKSFYFIYDFLFSKVVFNDYNESDDIITFIKEELFILNKISNNYLLVELDNIANYIWEGERGLLMMRENIKFTYSLYKNTIITPITVISNDDTSDGFRTMKFKCIAPTDEIITITIKQNINTNVISFDINN